jgi:hypothetical protein
MDELASVFAYVREGHSPGSERTFRLGLRNRTPLGSDAHGNGLPHGMSVHESHEDAMLKVGAFAHSAQSKVSGDQLFATTVRNGEQTRRKPSGPSPCVSAHGRRTSHR